MNSTPITTLPELSARLDRAEDRARAAENRAAVVEGRCSAAEGRYARAEKRFRVLCGTLCGATTLALSLPFVSPAVAQGYGMTLAQAATRIAALEAKTASMSVVSATDSSNTSGQQTVRFSGVNVQIVDGTGGTEGTQSGLGNLIIGYNEKRGAGDVRTGNHNLVAGVFNNYSGNGGVVFGYRNSISSVEATVTGGVFNTASTNQASVSGGYQNTASGQYSSVSGGASNTASGDSASVSGGQGNAANTFFSSVSGGQGNTASGIWASVSGGISGRASNANSSVSGGFQNTASGNSASVSGGSRRTVASDDGWAGGSYTSP